MGREVSLRTAVRTVAAVVIVVAASVWTWAQVQPSGIVFGCLSPSGFIRGVDEGGACRSGDVPLSWYTRAGADAAFLRTESAAGGDLVGTYPNPTLAHSALEWSRITNKPPGFADGLDNEGGSAGPVEPWHEVGSPGEPPFQAGWFNDPAWAGYESAGFYKDPFGVVRLKGRIHRDSHSRLQIFVLPEGYRPMRIVQLPACCGLNASVVISPDGTVLYGGGAGTVFLDGVSFRAEQ